MPAATRWPAALASLIGIAALVFLHGRGLTYVHIDAIAHVNKARSLTDNFAPGLIQHGSVWLPFPHLFVAPLAMNRFLWTSGLAGSVVSLLCFIGVAVLVFHTARSLSDSPASAWLAFALFALNPRLIYLFATPMTEPLMILSAAAAVYCLTRWIQSSNPRYLAWCAVAVFVGTWTRYEGWVLAAAFVALVAGLARRNRSVTTLFFAAAVCAGPLLWFLYNRIYFEDPLFFLWGRGSAAQYAVDYWLANGRGFPAAGSWFESIRAYAAASAYSVGPAVLIAGIAGVGVALKKDRTGVPLLVAAAVPIGFYVINLFAGRVPLLMPGLAAVEPESIYNVRYGALMAASMPVAASLLARRPVVLAAVIGASLILPSPIPPASREPWSDLLTGNLFYREAIRNQSFWIEPFVAAGRTVAHSDGLILGDSRHLHPIVWSGGVPIRRFVHELHREKWRRCLNRIDPDIEWVVAEEGDQLWNAQESSLRREWIEVMHLARVHLFRRKQGPAVPAGQPPHGRS